MPVEVKELRLTGGLTRSEAWCQTIADVFEAEAVPVEGEGAALGAAIHAAWVWLEEEGKDVSIQEIVSRFVKLEERRRKRPEPANLEIYRRQKRLFEALSRRVRGLKADDPFRLRTEMME
jgi:xylulokinase